MAVKKNTDKNLTELYFEWWLCEMQKLGLVKYWERETETFILRNAEPIFYAQNFATKQSVFRTFNLNPEITYTPDYKVIFSDLLLGKLTGVIDNEKLLHNPNDLSASNVYQDTLYYAHSDFKTAEHGGGYWFYFDVKAPSSATRFSAKLGSSRDFGLKRRLMFEVHKIIVNKVVPIGADSCLFNKTFMPLRYRYNDSGAALRKLRGKPCDTIDQWLVKKEIIINNK